VNVILQILAGSCNKVCFVRVRGICISVGLNCTTKDEVRQ